jgi:signal transduction histidine kinase
VVGVANSDAGRSGGPALLEAVLAVSADLDHDSVLHRIVETACTVTGARYGFLGLLDEHGELTGQAVHGLTDDDSARLDAFLSASRLPDGPMRVEQPVRVGEWARLRGAGSRTEGDVPGSSPEGRATEWTGRTFLGSPVRAGGRVLGHLHLTHKADGGAFTEADELAVRVLARVGGVAIRNARSYNLSERRRAWVEATAQLATSLHPPVRLDELLGHVARGARSLARATVAAVVHHADHGHDVPALDGPCSGSVPALLDAHGDRIAVAQSSGKASSTPVHGGGTLVLLPLDRDLAFEGVLLVVLDRGRGLVPAEEMDLLTSFASQASLALDRAVTLVDRQEAMVAEDRDRIARDLHDLVIQRLFATGLQLQRARRGQNPPETQKSIESAVRELDLSIRDIRSSIFELQHGQEASLRAGVAGLVREYAAVLGFSPTVRTSGAVDSLVGRSLAEQALAVLREALSNCARHAAAHSCLVEVTVEDGWLQLRVTDDGRGLVDDLHESGLRNLRRRADELGGTLLLEPAEPRGTRFVWRVPVTD